MLITHVVVTDSFAGTERYVCDIANRLSIRGHQVSVVGGNPDRMSAELDGPTWSPAPNVGAAIRRLAGRPRPDILHTHLTAAEVAALASRPWHRAPAVATRHIAARRGSSPLGRAIAPFVARYLSAEIAISRYVASSVDEASTIVLPSGVVAQPVSPPSQGRVVLVLQRLEPEKDTALALHAWALSGLGQEGWELQVAGDGSQRDALFQLRDRLGLQDSVRLLGFVQDAPTRLGVAAILLAPTRGEALGLSVLEAMARAVPVVAAGAGGHLETLGEDYVGLFAAGDAAAAAGTLRAFADDPQLRMRTGAALMDRQRDLFDLDKHVEALEELYVRVLSASARFGPRA